VRVVDADACDPIEGAAVDLWHCDAEGAYSGVEGAEGETFCRGIQLTDAAGAAEFRTIFPGWYTGRVVHIHAKVSADDEETHTRTPRAASRTRPTRATESTPKAAASRSWR
jgi:protocatechuate 3,4-dioxygenase beta subunit